MQKDIVLLRAIHSGFYLSLYKSLALMKFSDLVKKTGRFEVKQGPGNTLLARDLAERGVEILLVPSCTEALEGYWRVRIGAMARALEGQCVTVMSSLVGKEPRLYAVEENTGAGGVFGPPDRGFPPTGVIAEGRLDRPGWTYADVDLGAVRDVRADGHVLNLAHWPEQSLAVSRKAQKPAA